MEQPGNRDLGDAVALRLGDLTQRVDDWPGAVAVNRREVEIGATAVGALLLALVILAREQAAGERAPYHQADPFRLQHRHDFTLEVAADQGVIGLERDRPGETVALRQADRLGDLPGCPV